MQGRCTAISDRRQPPDFIRQRAESEPSHKAYRRADDVSELDSDLRTKKRGKIRSEMGNIHIHVEAGIEAYELRTCSRVQR